MSASAVKIKPPLTDYWLRQALRRLEAVYQRPLARHDALVMVAVCVLDHYLGWSWVEEHPGGVGGIPSYMRPQHDPRPRVRPEQLDTYRSNDRAYRLAERLMNFHTVSGVEGRIKR